MISSGKIVFHARVMEKNLPSFRISQRCPGASTIATLLNVFDETVWRPRLSPIAPPPLPFSRTGVVAIISKALRETGCNDWDPTKMELGPWGTS